MSSKEHFEVIIIGGSYAGLSAAMALGRSLRNVLVIDGGKPCNRQTPHAHNVITLDGRTPGEISSYARRQVTAYPSVNFLDGIVTAIKKAREGFEVLTDSGDSFFAKKIFFGTGMRDLLPDIPGYRECWAISVIHCPYCHGYEVHGKKTGILANGDVAFHYAPLIANLTDDLTIFTNGPSTFTEEQSSALKRNGILIVEAKITSLSHTDGQLNSIVFADGSDFPLTVLYNSPPNEQHCPLPAALGCEITEQGHIKTSPFQLTTIPGVYAGGDCTTFMRSLPVAIAAGNVAGAMINNELSTESFMNVAVST